MPSIEVGADVRMKRALNCWPWVWSLTHSPDAVIHSPAEIVAAWPMTVTRSRWPRAFARRTQKPFSLLWKVTRSTKPASTSWVDGSCCGLICVATVGASPPNRIWRPVLRSRSSSATRAPRVLSIGDRPLVGNRPAIQILGPLEAACDDGAIAAVGLITQGRPADSFGLSERCLLGDLLNIGDRARYDLVKPSTASGNRIHEARASFDARRPNFTFGDVVPDKNLQHDVCRRSMLRSGRR